MTRGNLAIVIHKKDSKGMLLFEKQGIDGVVKFLGNFDYVSHHIIEDCPDV